MDITIKDWFKFHRVNGCFFNAYIYVYKDKPEKKNLLNMITMDYKTKIENILDKIPKPIHDKKIKEVLFSKGDESDTVNFEICI